MMVERYPNLKEEVGSLIPGCEISFLLDEKLARWLTTSCAFALACRPSVSKKKEKEKKKKKKKISKMRSTSPLAFSACSRL
jgi:hypothetical protein